MMQAPRKRVTPAKRAPHPRRRSGAVRIRRANLDHDPRSSFDDRASSGVVNRVARSESLRRKRAHSLTVALPLTSNFV